MKPALLFFTLAAFLPFTADAAPRGAVFDIAIENTSTYEISMWVPFGSMSDSVPGIAHVLEHLKFKASDGKGFTAFNAIPGSSANAATDYRFTRFDLNVPKAGLVEALHTLAVMTEPLKITDADLRTEKSVVQQELLQRTQSNPDTQFYLDFYSELYKGMPLERPPGGSVASVESVSMKDVLEFDAAHYHNTAYYVQIAGPPIIEADRKAIVHVFPEATFGAIAVNRKFQVANFDKALRLLPALLPDDSQAAVTSSEFVHSKTSGRARSVKLSYAKLISAPTPWRRLAAASILQDAIRSRLPEGLRDKISDDAYLVQDWSLSLGRLTNGTWQLGFSATLQPDTKPDELRKIVETYIADFAQHGLSQTAFERLRKRDFLVSEWENTEGRIRGIGQDSVEFGLQNASSFHDELQTLKVDDVNLLLKDLAKPGRVGVALIKPEGAQ